MDNPPSIVLFHIDGDAVWSKRHTSNNAAHFENKTRLLVQQHVRAGLEKKGKVHEEADRLARLLPLVPFRSIESWLLQNTVEGRRLCQANGCGWHGTLFNDWEADRTLLDEIFDIKGATCLRDKHNLELAGAGYPTESVYAAGRSFSAAVECLRGCGALREALAATLPLPS